MWIFKISFFILCYFMVRIAISTFEPHPTTQNTHSSISTQSSKLADSDSSAF